jgi:hypothetical protein
MLWAALRKARSVQIIQSIPGCATNVPRQAPNLIDANANSRTCSGVNYFVTIFLSYNTVSLGKVNGYLAPPKEYPNSGYT